MPTLKPLVLHSHPGPNPWKIALLLEELSILYTTKIHTTLQLKDPAFLSLNRNGMTPVIEDPNTGLILAESGAITDYILSQYDTTHHLSFPSFPENHHMNQWLQFQSTTQGPILQQIFHWTFFDSNPVAKAHYVKSFHRVLQVLDDELADREWLVGEKCSAADLSFFSFQSRIGFIMREDAPDVSKEYANVEKWYQRMLERGSVKKVLGDHLAVLKSLGF